MSFKNYFFQNFRGCVLLFSYQGSCRFDSFDILSYLFELVKNFFKFFQLFCFSCLSLFRDSSDIISCALHFVKHFFHLFCRGSKAHSAQLLKCIITLNHCQVLFCKTFLIKRRRRDLNPRTARTVYTLSRGASSAT